MKPTFLLLLVAFCARLFAQTPAADSAYLCDNYTKREVMIPKKEKAAAPAKQKLPLMKPAIPTIRWTGCSC